MKPDSDPSSENLSLYAGRWVARVQGTIIGQGGTPEQALQAAKAARYKETPEISFIPMATPLNYPPLLEDIRAALPADVPVHLVGGAVRDLLLGRPLHDYDFVLPEQALEISRRLADRIGAAYYPLDTERGTARLILMRETGDRDVLDFATYRGPTLESDLCDRDFTINAMALDLQAPQQLIDPLGGAADLRKKNLRACSHHSLADDPIRVLRAIRMAANLGLHIQPETRQLMRQATPDLVKVSPERQRDELLKILGGRQPSASIRALEMLGVLAYVFPEIPALAGVTQSAPHTKDVWNHTLDTLKTLENIADLLAATPDPDASGHLMLGILSLRLGRFREQVKTHLQTELVPGRPARSLLFLAALYHDVSKPQTLSEDEDGRVRFFGHDELGAKIIARRGEALHLSNPETQRLELIVRHHMRPSLLSHTPGGPSKRAIYRFFRDTGEAGVDICLLSLADVWATYGATLSPDRWKEQVETIRSLLAAWWENPEVQIRPPALISGNDLLQTFELKPGPVIGEILEAVHEAQAVGEITSRLEALDFVRVFLDQQKLLNPDTQS
ncbi:MAG: HD domain-containing protein [Anaerolineales bacterium]